MGDEKEVFIGELTKEYAKKTYDAAIFPPEQIVERIKHGRWPYELPK